MLIADGVWDKVQREEHEAKQEMVRELSSDLRRELASMVEVVRSVGALFETSEDVARSEFEIFTRFLRAAHPKQVQALEWIPLVANSERSSYERQARDDGLEGFEIWEKAESGGKVRAQDRSRFFPVYYVEPFAGNEQAVGFDLASNPSRKDAMHAASDSGQMQATAPIRLVQEQGTSAGVLLFVPVYRDATALAVGSEASPALLGFALGVFRIQDIMMSVLPAGYSGEIRVALVDESLTGERSELFNDGFEPTELTKGQSFLLDNRFEFGGRRWRLVGGSASGYEENLSTASYWGVVFAGFLLTGFSLAYLNATRLVHERNEGLRSANIALAKTTEEIERFYHTVSHELKTPLTSAREFASLLSDEIPGKVNEEQQEYLDYIIESCDLLTRYVNDMLDVTRIETGKLQIRPLPSSVERVVERCLSSQRFLAADRGVRILDFKTESLPLGMIDEQRIAQVINNLLTNAIKFTPDGGSVGVGVEVTSEEQPALCVSVRDSGIGIAESELENIFHRLHQVSQESARNESAGTEGLGLGLGISKEIVRLHGGEIWVESEVGRGTVFKFTVPAASRRGLIDGEESHT